MTATGWTRDQYISLAGLLVSVASLGVGALQAKKISDWACESYELLCELPLPQFLKSDEGDEKARQAEEQRKRDEAAAKSAQELNAIKDQLARLQSEERAREDRARAEREQAASEKKEQRHARKQPAGKYAATSYCGATGAHGSATAQATPELAMQASAADCVRNGGIDYCCNAGTSLTSGSSAARASYAATAYCSLTGAQGMALQQATPQAALRMAVLDCVSHGGVPSCCEHGAQLAQ